MTKSEIISLLTEKHGQFLTAFPPLSEKEFTTSINGKWSPAQQLDHIIRSVDPVVLAFSLPQFIPRILFGKANRPSCTYEVLIEKYHAKLAAGGKASGRFIPKAVPFQIREEAIARLNGLIQQLISVVENKKEEQLDTYILPHPLLGKLTFREMLYFTAYHAEHHEKATRKNLAA
jgi:hypothetical protein